MRKWKEENQRKYIVADRKTVLAAAEHRSQSWRYQAKVNKGARLLSPQQRRKANRKRPSPLKIKRTTLTTENFKSSSSPNKTASIVPKYSNKPLNDYGLQNDFDHEKTECDSDGHSILGEDDDFSHDFSYDAVKRWREQAERRKQNYINREAVELKVTKDIARLNQALSQNREHLETKSNLEARAMKQQDKPSGECYTTGKSYQRENRARSVQRAKEYKRLLEIEEKIDAVVEESTVNVFASESPDQIQQSVEHIADEALAGVSILDDSLVEEEASSKKAILYQQKLESRFLMEEARFELAKVMRVEESNVRFEMHKKKIEDAVEQIPVDETLPPLQKHEIADIQFVETLSENENQKIVLKAKFLPEDPYIESLENKHRIEREELIAKMLPVHVHTDRIEREELIAKMLPVHVHTEMGEKVVQKDLKEAPALKAKLLPEDPYIESLENKQRIEREELTAKDLPMHVHTNMQKQLAQNEEETQEPQTKDVPKLGLLRLDAISSQPAAPNNIIEHEMAISQLQLLKSKQKKNKVEFEKQLQKLNDDNVLKNLEEEVIALKSVLKRAEAGRRRAMKAAAKAQHDIKQLREGKPVLSRRNNVITQSSMMQKSASTSAINLPPLEAFPLVARGSKKRPWTAEIRKRLHPSGALENVNGGQLLPVAKLHQLVHPPAYNVSSTTTEIAPTQVVAGVTHVSLAYIRFPILVDGIFRGKTGLIFPGQQLRCQKGHGCGWLTLIEPFKSSWLRCADHTATQQLLSTVRVNKDHIELGTDNMQERVIQHTVSEIQKLEENVNVLKGDTARFKSGLAVISKVLDQSKAKSLSSKQNDPAIFIDSSIDAIKTLRDGGMVEGPGIMSLTDEVLKKKVVFNDKVAINTNKRSLKSTLRSTEKKKMTKSILKGGKARSWVQKHEGTRILKKQHGSKSVISVQPAKLSTVEFGVSTLSIPFSSPSSAPALSDVVENLLDEACVALNRASTLSPTVHKLNLPRIRILLYQERKDDRAKFVSLDSVFVKVIMCKHGVTDVEQGTTISAIYADHTGKCPHVVVGPGVYFIETFLNGTKFAQKVVIVDPLRGDLEKTSIPTVKIAVP